MKRSYQNDDNYISKRTATCESFENTLKDRIKQLENELLCTVNAFNDLKSRNKKLEEELIGQKAQHQANFSQIEKLVLQERKQYTDMLEKQQMAFSDWQKQICASYDDVVNKHKLYWSSIS